MTSREMNGLDSGLGEAESRRRPKDASGLVRAEVTTHPSTRVELGCAAFMEHLAGIDPDVSFGEGDRDTGPAPLTGRASTGSPVAARPGRVSNLGWDANSPPGLEFLFEARVDLHLPPMDMGKSSDGQRVIYLIKGGTFEGPLLRGRVVPDAGADWIKIRPDGTCVLDVRFSLETHDRALLYVH